ncbi:uncharacterized protein M421DRAFT_423830 [Didymella exigua CBS 183.55]|uniref:Uncharacterized protein n=1 Tax=Didymella exigua CBS 183.55 TaxID=1150837 RepID=A0A6A5RD96_9PLEO|nr:uncharacterized protein M421DRAFT_423830 [Didymella exigua CBS 183.55]KAF1925280.1 hypothetical protein M421DRAFT_423830 [Didymella exigua CBS 183.55]
MNFDLDHKALAYPASNLSDDEPVTPCLCSLVFRCDDAKLATLLLVARIPTAHGTADSEFVLQYDGDRLMPTNVRLVSGRGHLKPTQLDNLVPRKGKGKQRRDIKTLQLSTEQPSPVWCPASTTTFSPRPGHEAALQRLIDLAKETKIHVVFDFNQLHQSYKGSFKAFGKAAQGLVRYPVEAPLIERGLRNASWEVFAPTELAEAPPAYQGLRRRKRQRQESCGSPPPPPRSWTPTTPRAGSYTTEKTVSVSPETEAAALRHAQLDFHTNIYINTIVEDRVAARIEELNASQAAAIDAAVAKRLDAYFSSPSHAERLDAAVDRQVDATVKARLPDAVQDVFVSADPPSSPTSVTYDARGNRYPKLTPLTSAGKTFLPHLRTHLLDQFSLFQQQQLEVFKKRISEMYDDVASSAADDRIREQAEWETEREEHSVEISLLRRDTLDELWLEGQKVLEAGQEQVGELVDQLGEELVDRVGALVQRIEGLNGYCVRRIVAAEVARQWRRTGGVPKGFTKRFGRFLLTYPDPKLLGRKMRGDMEWVDVSFDSSFGYSRP